MKVGQAILPDFSVCYVVDALNAVSSLANAQVILVATTATGREKDFLAEMWGTNPVAVRIEIVLVRQGRIGHIACRWVNGKLLGSISMTLAVSTKNCLLL
jgi:hypothetical protein